MTIALSNTQFKYIRDLLVLEKLALQGFKNKAFSRGRDVPDSIQDELDTVNTLLCSVFCKRDDKSRV